MKKTLLKHFMLFAFVASLGILMNSCGEDTVTPNNPSVPEAGTMSGTITFVDTNKLDSNGYYDVSVYTSWPPSGPPSASDTVTITKNGDTYTGTFQVKGLTSGAAYVTTCAWIKTPYAPGSVYLLGVRGCDTSHDPSCWLMNPKYDTLPSSQGLNSIDFKSWIDTTNKLYNF
jgi:hypothetical protein